MMAPILLAETFSPRAKMLANRNFMLSRAEDSTSLQIMQPGGLEDCDFDFFQVIVKLTSQGINAWDVKILEEAGIHNYDGLMMHAKKSLIGYSGLPETKLDIICEAAEEILKFDYITRSDQAYRKPVIHDATANQGLDELLGGVIKTKAVTGTASKFQSCKTQLACTLGVSPKDLLGPSLHSLLSHSPRIGDGGNSKGSVDPQDMDSADSSSGDDQPDNNVDNVPLMPVANGLPPPIPVLDVGHNGDGDQAVPNLHNGGGDPWVSVYIDGIHADDYEPLATEDFMSLCVRLALTMYYHPNGIRTRAVGFRITYWSGGLQRLLIPINVNASSPQWEAFRDALRRINIHTNVEP